MWPFESKRTKEIKKIKKSIYKKLNDVQYFLSSDIAIVHVLTEDKYIIPMFKENFFGYSIFIEDKSFVFVKYKDGRQRIIAYHLYSNCPIGIIAYDAHNYRKTQYLDGYNNSTILPMLYSIDNQLDYFIEYTKSPDFLTKLNKKIKEK